MSGKVISEILLTLSPVKLKVYFPPYKTDSHCLTSTKCQNQFNKPNTYSDRNIKFSDSSKLLKFNLFF